MTKTKAPQFALGIAILVGVAVIIFWRGESASRGKATQKEDGAAPVAGSAASAPKLEKPPAPTPPTVAPPTQPAPTPSPTLSPASSRSPDAQPPSPHARLTESSLMERLRNARAEGKHPLAIQLAREGNRRFPDSTFAPERHSILVHSLADNEQRNEARGEAELMVNHYPDSDWVREVERFTGAHRHRNVRLNDAGEIQYY